MNNSGLSFISSRRVPFSARPTRKGSQSTHSSKPNAWARRALRHTRRPLGMSRSPQFEDMLDKTLKHKTPQTRRSPDQTPSNGRNSSRTRRSRSHRAELPQKLDKASGSSQNLPLDTPICTANHESSSSWNLEQRSPMAKSRRCPVHLRRRLRFHESIRDRDMCGGGCALREMLFPDELQRFETTGKRPRNKRRASCAIDNDASSVPALPGLDRRSRTKFADMHVNLCRPRDCLDGTRPKTIHSKRTAGPTWWDPSP